MSYHHSMLPLGWIMPEMASYGLTDSDRINPTAKASCGDAKAVQGALKDQGFYSGAIDGILGKGSVSAIAAFSKAKGIGNISWPNPTFCAKLREEQQKLLVAEFERRNPPAPPQTQGGGQVAPVTGGGVTPVAPIDQPLPVAVEDNTMLYVAAGVVGLVAIGAAVYLARSLWPCCAIPPKPESRT